jgi:3-oxoacyl-[acyl-carrier-protein] synthase-3
MPYLDEQSQRLSIRPSRAQAEVERKVYVGRVSVAKKKAPLVAKLSGIKVLGAGASSGSKWVPNEALNALGCDADWIYQRTGIQGRYHVADGESTSDMAIRAAEQCLERSGVAASEVDLIIVATVTPDYPTPSTACIVQAHLGCTAAAYDLNAACSGFMYGLITASQAVKTGCSRNALVIGAETLTMLMNPEDKKTFPLFGDGAGAVLISADGTSEESMASGILAYRLASEGVLGNALKAPGGGSKKPFSQEVLDRNEQYLVMDGRTVFKWAVRLIPEIVNEMLEKANLTLSDIDLFIPHQANVRIIDAAVDELGIEQEKVFVNLDRYGNTSAASIPIAISEALAQGRIKPGDHVLMVGFGAGLTWGACLFRW